MRKLLVLLALAVIAVQVVAAVTADTPEVQVRSRAALTADRCRSSVAERRGGRRAA
jgi:hypothetical protein